MKFDEEGREIPDQTPVEIPANAKRPESMQETMARMIALHMDQVAEKNGMPSFEEEDDFDDPTDNVTEVAGDYYITEAHVEPIGPENDLEGSQGIPRSRQDKEEGSTGKPPEQPQEPLQTVPEAEAPQE